MPKYKVLDGDGDGHVRNLEHLSLLVHLRKVGFKYDAETSEISDKFNPREDGMPDGRLQGCFVYVNGSDRLKRIVGLYLTNLTDFR